MIYGILCLSMMMTNVIQYLFTILSYTVWLPVGRQLDQSFYELISWVGFAILHCQVRKMYYWNMLGCVHRINLTMSRWPVPACLVHFQLDLAQWHDVRSLAQPTSTLLIICMNKSTHRIWSRIYEIRFSWVQSHGSRKFLNDLRWIVQDCTIRNIP